MKITRLAPGEVGPNTADRVHINVFKDGRAGWTGIRSAGNVAHAGIGRNEQQSPADAEAEAIEWARRNGVTDLIIETDDA